MKLASQAHQFLQTAILEAGGKLGEAQSAPWRKLANVLAINHLQIFNWSPDCPYLPNTTGAKGIEGAHTHGLRALVGQFLDKDMPVRIQKINDLGHQQALLNSTRPVISTVAFSKPLSRQLLFADNTIHEEIVHVGKASQAAALEEMPSSELTPLEDSSNLSASPTPSPAKPPPPPNRKRQPKKDILEKRKIHVVFPGSEESNAESPPKRLKPPSPTSNSSIEVGEVQPPPKASRAQATKKVTASKSSVTNTWSRSKSKKALKAKSKEYVEDSDDNMEGIVQDEQVIVPPKPSRLNTRKADSTHTAATTVSLPARPKPRPKVRKADIAPDITPVPTPSPSKPPPPSTQISVASTPPLSLNPLSPEVSRRTKSIPPLSKPPSSQRGDHAVLAELKRHLAPSQPVLVSGPALLASHISKLEVNEPPAPPAPRTRTPSLPPLPSPAASRPSSNPSSDRGHEYPNVPSAAQRSPHPEYEGAYSTEGGYRATHGYAHPEGRYDDRYMGECDRYGYGGIPPSASGYPPREYVNPFNHRYQYYPLPPHGPYDYRQYGGEPQHGHHYQQPPSPYMDYHPVPTQPHHHPRRHPDPATPSRPSRAASPEAGPLHTDGF